MAAAQPALPEQMPPLEPVSLLSMPKNAVCKDELSGRPAALQLALAGGALRFFYSDAATAALDYATLRHVAPLLQTIREEEAAGGNTAERAIRAAKARQATAALAAACGALAAQRNREGAYDTANPAALRYLRALSTLHGEGSVELVPGLLALAESCIGLGPARAASASEMLFTGTSLLAGAARAAASGGGSSGAGAGAGASAAAAAPAAAREHDHHALHCRLQLLYGRLALAQGKPGEAVEAFSRALYRAASAGGPEHLGAGTCLYLLGRAFAARGASASDGAAALQCYERAVGVYALHCSGSVPAGAAAVGYAPPPRPPPGSVDAAAAASPPGAPLAPLEYKEACEALEGVAGARRAALGDAALATAEARWALARVHALQGARAPALQCIDEGGVEESFCAALVRVGWQRCGGLHAGEFAGCEGCPLPCPFAAVNSRAAASPPPPHPSHPTLLPALP